MTKTTPCAACSLHVNCPKTQNNSAGWGNPKAKLVIMLDSPGDHLAEKLLIWIMRKLGLGSDDVWVDYLVKCPIPKGVKKDKLVSAQAACWTQHHRKELLGAKSLVIAGSWGSKLVLHRQMKDIHGRKDKETEAWVVYSFKYLLMNPAECVDTWRVIYKAAEEAGLKPRMIIDVEAFKFPSRKLVAG